MTPYHRGSWGGWKHRADTTLSLKRTIKVGFLNKFSYNQVQEGLGQSLESSCSFRRWRNGSDLSFGFLSHLPQERPRWSILSQAGSVHLADTLNDAAGVPVRGYLTLIWENIHQVPSYSRALMSSITTREASRTGCPLESQTKS